MNHTANGAAAPTSQAERIGIIDSLRGIALLGILLMNIPWFGLSEASAENLTLKHELGTINQKIWYIVDWALEGSQRAIFSMLFGAGVILFTSRLEKRTSGTAPADYFIRRQLWLLVFGLFDAFVLLWFGDVLFTYAVAGIIVFAFRNLSPKKLILAAGVSLVLMTARENIDFYRHKQVISKGEAIAALDTTRVKLTDQQRDDLTAMTEFKKREDSASQRKAMENEVRKVSGSYSELYAYRSRGSAEAEVLYTYYGIWDVLLFMFLGMAFFKTGILMGNAPARLYWVLFLVGACVGMLISWLRLRPVLEYRFDHYLYTKHVAFEYYELSRTIRSLGIFGLVMLLYKSGWFNRLFTLMRPVGQMAFTNYLMQSLVCGLYFYGIGFGMFGKLQRYEIYYVVGVVWVIEIVWSHLWLRYFRYGPLEWLWRSLTYWKLQPMKRGKEK